jgi:hypothetical protein
MLVLALKLLRNIAMSEARRQLRRHRSQWIASGRGPLSFHIRDDSLMFPEEGPYGWAIVRF